jgi:hypothetical protein
MYRGWAAPDPYLRGTGSPGRCMGSCTATSTTNTATAGDEEAPETGDRDEEVPRPPNATRSPGRRLKTTNATRTSPRPPGHRPHATQARNGPRRAGGRDGSAKRPSRAVGGEAWTTKGGKYLPLPSARPTTRSLPFTTHHTPALPFSTTHHTPSLLFSTSHRTLPSPPPRRGRL